METVLENLRSKLEQKRGYVSKAKQDLEECRKNIREAEANVVYSTDALSIIQVVAEETQSEVEESISDVVSLSLQAVFENPHPFTCEFDKTRGRSAARLLVGDSEDVTNTFGGGVADVTAFGLRIAIWAIQPNAKVLFLDEPFRYVSKELIPNVVDLLKMLSKELGIQFIIVTHSAEMMKGADRVFEIKQIKGKSKVITKEDRDDPIQVA